MIPKGSGAPLLYPPLSPAPLTTNRPAPAHGSPSIPESERPRRRHVLGPRMKFSLPPACTQRAAGRGQPGRRQEAGRAAKAARARAVRGP